MHTAEHILNQTMIRTFGCKRSMTSHIERKKSKCDYILSSAPTQEQVDQLEFTVNEVINRHLQVEEAWVSKEDAAELADLSRLPDAVEDTIRLVRVGDYDTCACSGPHVSNTAEIGHFQVISHDFEEGRWRLRWKVMSTVES